MVFRGCVAKVGEVKLEADLIPLEIKDFDAILGMDWLNWLELVSTASQSS